MGACERCRRCLSAVAAAWSRFRFRHFWRSCERPPVQHKLLIGEHLGRCRRQAPSRWVADNKRGTVRDVALLDASPAAAASQLGMDHTSVLVDLAEEVLAVDQLQRATPQRLELDIEVVKTVLCRVR